MVVQRSELPTIDASTYQSAKIGGEAAAEVEECAAGLEAGKDVGGIEWVVDQVETCKAEHANAGIGINVPGFVALGAAG